MIKVEEAEEPENFDRKVRQPGLKFLQETLGRTSGKAPENFKWKPYWRECRAELRAAYHGICAYMGGYVEMVTGGETVEHFIPKSLDISLAYEWSNFRFVCQTLNGRKGNNQDVTDPFHLPIGTFQINFLDGSIHPNSELSKTIRQTVLKTINRLQLNDESCRNYRLGKFEDYKKGFFTLEYLKRRYPFVYQEILRQGLE